MKEEVGKFTMEKSILGHCTLTIMKARREDAGVYKCKIDNTKHVTKCSVSFKGLLCCPNKRGLRLGELRPCSHNL